MYRPIAPVMRAGGTQTAKNSRKNGSRLARASQSTKNNPMATAAMIPPAISVLETSLPFTVSTFQHAKPHPCERILQGTLIPDKRASQGIDLLFNQRVDFDRLRHLVTAMQHGGMRAPAE